MAANTGGNEEIEELLLESTFEIKNQRYAVKLTRNDIQWNSVGPTSGPHTELFIKTSYSQLQQLFYESNTPDKVYYQPVSQTDPDEPVLLLPVKQTTAGIVSCCSSSYQELQSSFCNLCGRRIKNENKRLSLREVFAVVRGDSHVGNSVTTSDDDHTSFTIWAIYQSKKYTWIPCKTVFRSSDTNVVHQWLNTIGEIISQPGFSRPKTLLVFINPISGKRRAVKIFREKIAPLFHLAKITAHVMQTERRYHARDILQTYNLHDVDGVVSVGGDGLFAEIVDGLLTRTMKEDGTDLITLDTHLLQPKWRIGIIPAGSTDTVSYSTQGINDPVTSALHIILGDSLALDVGTIFHNKQFLRYNISFFGYGYYGDCILDSEQNRWMGPKRYDWEGFKKVISNRSYTGEISFLLSSDKESHPRDGTSCKAGCLVCRSMKEALADGWSSKRTTNYSSEDNGGRWQTVRGRFVAVNSFLMSCRCRYALKGPAPAAHLGNGCSDLVLVHDCSRLQYVQHLYRCTIPSADQFEFPFIQVFRITRFKFRLVADEDEEAAGSVVEGRARDGDRLHGRSAFSTSVWNCDGEVVDEPVVEYLIHPQLIRLFARGIEDVEKDSTSGCWCC